MVSLNSTFHPFPSSVPVEQITIDDFDELSNSFSLKIGFLFTILTDFFISDVLAMLFILYDKYGEDSMKRPIYNRLNSQFAYPVIISNLLSRPAWTWRTFMGPISSTAADAVVLIGKNQGYKIICIYNIDHEHGHERAPTEMHSNATWYRTSLKGSNLKQALE